VTKILAVAAVAAAVLGAAVPASAQFYTVPYVAPGYYYGPGYGYWGGPRVYVAPRYYSWAPAYGYRAVPYGGYWNEWD
jgi:hypothetical protein